MLREQGYACEIVERWNPWAKVRQDLFGIGDILAIKDGETLLVQTTSRSNVTARVKKISESEMLPAILKARWRVVVHGWGELKDGWDCKTFAAARRRAYSSPRPVLISSEPIHSRT
ncbi:MAG: hypothetical protein EBZ49_17885 [Proteobacteria bacterium]|nr:hypothetical protein [Pseudomonadota bacterium]